MTALALGLATLFAALPVRAHPHAWIDLRGALLFNEAGQATGLRVNWLFDEFYTIFALDGLETDGEGRPTPQALRSLAELNVTSLADYDYFTKLTLDGQPAETLPVTEYESFVWEDRLVLVFTLPLAEPLELGDSRLTYSVYDPTYYIEILHVEEDPVVFEGAAPASCGHELIKPTPDLETVSLAASLDQTESVGDWLGNYFAERVVITCPPGAE
ncbi:MAG: DUF1007 family protein [Pseudomonadota bacterium]